MASRDVDKLPTGIEVRSGHIRISFYLAGKRKRESIGLPATKQNIKLAAKKREAILYEIKIGTFSYAAHFPDSKHAVGKPKAKTIGELTKLFLESKEHDIRSSTYQRYMWVLRDFAKNYGETRSCETLSPRSLTSFRNQLVKNIKARTVNRNLVTINGFLKWLHKMEYVARDLSDVMPRVKELPADIRPFSIEEVNKAVGASKHLQHRNMFILFAYTGIRSGELCALAWEDVDFVNKTIHIRRSTYDNRGLKTTKTDTERYVDLLPPAIEALKAQRHITYLLPAKEHDVELAGKQCRTERLRFVFNPKCVREQRRSDYDYYGKRGPGKIWKDLCKKAGIPYRNQYQLRHTYASWLITHANINVSYLAQQMGHRDITMVSKIYGKWLVESNKKESDRVWTELEKLHG